MALYAIGSAGCRLRWSLPPVAVDLSLNPHRSLRVAWPWRGRTNLTPPTRMAPKPQVGVASYAVGRPTKDAVVTVELHQQR